MAKGGDVVLLNRNGKYKTKLLQNIVKQNHPILVLYAFSNNMIRICAMSSNISTDVRNGKYSQDVILKDWQQAGLQKETYVGTDTSGTISKSLIYKTIGSLSARDRRDVLLAYNTNNQRQLLETYKIYNTGEPEYLDYYLDENRRMIFLDAEK